MATVFYTIYFYIVNMRKGRTGGTRMDYASLYIDRIRSLCRKRGITINKLATMSGVKQSTLDNIVRGQTKNPRVKTLHKLAIGLNVTLAELVDFSALNEYSFEDDTDE